MSSLSLKPLSFSTYTSLNPKRNLQPHCKSHYQTERGHQFDVGDTFFRSESATARDLGVLSAALYRKTAGSLRVLDAMCGCGIRSLRYLAEAEADFVVANDANVDYREVILGNLSSVSSSSRWEVNHLPATRLLAECYVRKDYFDLIDVDSFGSGSSYLRVALDAVKLGGLLYITSTDGLSSGGHRPQQSLAAYGAYVQPLPYCNEIGLRMLIGGAVREASVLGYHVVPLFSYYSYHGPVFRVLLQVKRGKSPSSRYYSFISYCNQCGNSQAFSWNELGEISCPCSTNVSRSLMVSGPLWTGPLHNARHLTEMMSLAERWGWLGDAEGKNLEKLLKLMIDESDPKLPVGYLNADEIASRGKLNLPPLSAIMNSLHEEGYAVSRSHIASSAIKTDCPMVECVRIVKQLQQPAGMSSCH
ncbi:PREDICTED: tRNA (guanine(26)-N(2))-dimethyltransferase [Nicotiana attenuata]|uniref:Trna (Guanine(26)-n(2))-dimethyltransferase 1 n=1 Tax=Nicotiana attenuata TaxID=49451 RepID=A0A1J6HSH5_NICAT|nr:PREDICTED: tRNA (guanine(26)-N(2))-dimethyltransferase [Nicotiana attenuata]OIS95868.1 putative trna (guanine(26)-n(2))-dimethyltransferase 1 [Nicotiana attenuata]